VQLLGERLDQVSVSIYSMKKGLDRFYIAGWSWSPRHRIDDRSQYDQWLQIQKRAVKLTLGITVAEIDTILQYVIIIKATKHNTKTQCTAIIRSHIHWFNWIIIDFILDINSIVVYNQYVEMIMTSISFDKYNI
jgi:hypothetical protein